MTRKIIIAFLLTCACLNLQAQVNVITTIAGNGTAGFCCDNGPASSAELNQPETICLDKHGNIYVADAAGNRVRKIDGITKIISTIAGNGTGAYFGDGGMATNAELFIPDAVVVDSSENVYIADGLNHRIRKIDYTTGIITTICGNGIAGNSGDGLMATDAEINGPTGLFVDKSGNIFIVDVLSNNLRKVDGITGKIFTIAGTGTAGYSGDGGQATNAMLSQPAKVCVDDSGNVFFTELLNNIVRKVNSIGIITTIAGNGIAGYSGDGGLAANSRLNQPSGIFIDELNNIFIADWGNGVVRKIDKQSGDISTIVGSGVQGYSGDGGPATNAKLYPDGVWVDNFGTMYIADMNNNRIRMVFNPKLGVQPQKNSEERVSIYPNPTKDELNVEYEFVNGEDGVMQITDVMGRGVISQKLSSHKQKEEVNINHLSPGLYLYKVVQNNVLISTGKVVKE